jgi:hypothetical protein
MPNAVIPTGTRGLILPDRRRNEPGDFISREDRGAETGRHQKDDERRGHCIGHGKTRCMIAPGHGTVSAD